MYFSKYKFISVMKKAGFCKFKIWLFCFVSGTSSLHGAPEVWFKERDKPTLYRFGFVEKEDINKRFDLEGENND